MCSTQEKGQKINRKSTNHAHTKIGNKQEHKWRVKKLNSQESLKKQNGKQEKTNVTMGVERNSSVVTFIKRPNDIHVK